MVLDLIVDVILHDVVESSNLLLERQDFVHKLLADLLVLDVDHQSLVLVNLLVQGLDLFKDSLTLLLTLQLQLLDVVEKFLLGELQL